MRRLLFVPLLLVGCSKSSDVTVLKVPKETHAHGEAGAAPPPEAAPAPAGGAMQGSMDAAPASTALNWTDPSGWTRQPGSGMRVATYALAEGTECTVISLAGAAGGDLANVNRWRGQMGLPDIPSLQGQAASVKTPLGSALVVDFEGAGPQAGRRMVAAIVTDGGTSWFFKLVGPKAAVAKAKPNLIQLLGTLRRA